MRRILIFSLVYYPRNIGGAEVAVKEITDRIDPNGCVFDMITLRKQAPAFERVGNIAVHRVGWPWSGRSAKSSKIFPLSKSLFPFTAFFKAVSLHRKNKYDAVWPIMASYAGFAAWLFKLVHPEVPMILTIQEGDNFERREGMFKGLFVRIFKRADRITAISRFLADWSRDMGATCPIEIIPNGVDLALFRAETAPAAAEALKQELGKKADDVFLVTASRLVAKNAVDDIISALQYLPANVKLLILGAGALEGDLKAQAVRLGLNSKNAADPDRVLFMGFVGHQELPRYLQISDIFVRPSRSEGLGNSFLEAMAAGIPVIGTAVGGIPDFLKDGETGLFCETDNPRSIAQKAEKLLKDRESRDYIVRNARKMVEERYGWDLVATEMKKVLYS